MRIFTLLEDLNLPAFDAPAFHKFLREGIQNTGLLPFSSPKCFCYLFHTDLPYVHQRINPLRIGIRILLFIFRPLS